MRQLFDNNSPYSFDEKFRKAAEYLVGDLDAAHIKLSWTRMEELMQAEKERLEASKVGYMWEQFEAGPAKSDGMLAIIEQMQPENMFKKLVSVSDTAV